jgi:formate hydrogenlyase subunit 6/NADH:ubiquinone oxidoreductase subunit I
MEQYTLTGSNLKKLAEKLLTGELPNGEASWDVVSVSEDGLHYQKVMKADQLILNSKAAPTKISFKEYFLPKSETLFYYKQNQNDVELSDPEKTDKKTVIFGARPCDAASLPVLEKVFNWDYHDAFFNNRIANTFIVGLACGYSDEYCFCNSVGLSPNSEKGSDIFLTPQDDGSYHTKIVTQKGKDFIAAFKEFFDSAGCYESPGKESPEQARNFDYKNIKNWLDNNFANSFWDTAGELCMGCAQCAFVCPTCHCFDIVDENCGLNCGRRAKNWDSCQFSIFTKHTSGHNPRENQNKRYRQRIMHKFKYYNDKFEEILCTGCGRCSRGCEAGIDIAGILEEINNLP